VRTSKTPSIASLLASPHLAMYWDSLLYVPKCCQNTNINALSHDEK
jgi:hypothetical protein